MSSCSYEKGKLILKRINDKNSKKLQKIKENKKNQRKLIGYYRKQLFDSKSIFCNEQTKIKVKEK